MYKKENFYSEYSISDIFRKFSWIFGEHFEEYSKKIRRIIRSIFEDNSEYIRRIISRYTSKNIRSRIFFENFRISPFYIIKVRNINDHKITKELKVTGEHVMITYENKNEKDIKLILAKNLKEMNI
jgi:hypothetical protein